MIAPKRLLFFLILTFLAPVLGTIQSADAFDSDLFREHGAIMLLIEPTSGAIVDANKAAVAYYGYSHDQMQNMFIQQINTFSRSEVEQEFRLAAEQKRNYFQFQHRLANDSIRSVEVYSSPVTIDGRKLLFSIIHDVDQRTRLERSVIENETRLRFAERAAGLGHWTLDLDTNAYHLSDGAMALLGWDEKIIDAQVLRDMVMPEHLHQMEQLRQTHIAGREDYSINIRFERPDGVLIDLHSEGRYDPTTNAMFGILHDITKYQEALRTIKSRTTLFYVLMASALLLQMGIIALLIYSIQRRKKAEKALRESEQRFEQLANQNRSIVWETDAQGRYTFVSDVIRDVLGYEPEEVIDQLYFYDWHPVEGREEFKSASLGVFTRREEFNRLENPIETREGKIVWVATTGFPMVDAQNNLLGYRGIDVDITERKIAQFSLEEKNREIKEFTDIVCHDLRSPLVTISSFLPILEQDISVSDTEQIRSDLAYIRSATLKMDQLLAALQQIFRIEQANTPPVTVSAASLVEDSLTILAGPLRQRQINVRVEKISLHLHGDALQFGQIWQNLVENAIKYMGEQIKPEITIGVEMGGEEPVFYVRDNGIGVEPQHAERIFNLFVQLDPHSGGRGLGLALVEKIVKRYGGRLWVESQGIGHGSCFRFTLPLAMTASHA